jgi:hypothetical protein
MKRMIFLLPVLGIAARAAVATVTVGEAIGIGATAIGIGAGIKGAVDYQKAKKLKEDADKEYQEMAGRLRRRAMKLKKSSRLMAS